MDKNIANNWSVLNTTQEYFWFYGLIFKLTIVSNVIQHWHQGVIYFGEKCLLPHGNYYMFIIEISLKHEFVFKY